MLQLLIVLSLIAALDFYGYQAFRTALGKARWLPWLYWGFHLLLYAGIAVLIANGRETPRWFFTSFFSFWVVCYLPKLFLALPLLIEDVGRLARWSWRRLTTSRVAPPAGAAAEPGPDLTAQSSSGSNKISRSKFISQLALGIASVPFAGTLYGVTLGKYDYRLRRVKIPIANLPQAFEGFTITHISDIHTGSFDDKRAVWRGIEMVNEQNSDLIFFTGDLINTYIDEVKGYEDIFSSLTAPQGVFSVLGNHDYGNYAQWPDERAKADHFKKVIDTHGQFGWNLLMNEHQLIQRDGHRLAIIGVENWGKSRHFPKKGDLAKALDGARDAEVKLLLSHDPSHWDAQVRPEYNDIDVTFSGHTHGFQFGVEIPGVKWSPAQYMYEEWAGLYQKENQYLYVNRGFGFLGFAGRVGIWPEVTVIELTRA